MSAVVCYHAFPSALPGGFVGVDIFFVISGYLITTLLLREHAGTGRIDFAAFYARRARRLLPALLAMLVGTMALMVAFMGRHELLIDDAATSSLWSLAFAVNLHFQSSVGGYFDAAAHTRPLLHLWSLSVEEQFYLIFPWLLAVLLARGPATRARWLALATLASFLLSEYWANVEPGAGFYQMPSRFWELGAGSLVAFAPSNESRRVRGLLAAGLLLCLLSCLQAHRWGGFPGKAALPVILGASLMLLAVHRGGVTGYAGSMLRSRGFVMLGLVSYPLYLWHWPLLVMANQAGMQPAGTGIRLATCAVALLLAIVSWRFIETPARRLRIHQPWRWLGSWLIVACVAGTLLIGLSKVKRVPADVQRMSAAARADMPVMNEACRFPDDREVRALLPAACNSRPSQTPTIVLWGDSHASAWQPFAWRLAAASNASAMALTLNSCPPGPVVAAAGRGANCEQFNRLAMQWLERHPVDTLVVAQRWPRPASEAVAVPASLALRVDALEQALRGLRHVQRIIVMGPLPTTSRHAPDCIALGWDVACSSETVLHRARVAPVWTRLEAMASRFPNVVLVDPTDYFCDDARCPPALHGFGLYRDDNHITASASRDFADAYLADSARYTRRPRAGARNPDLP